MSRLQATAIIPTRNRPEEIVKCLSYLQKQSRQFDQVIVVDSSDAPLIDLAVFRASFSREAFSLADKISLIYKHTAPGLPYQRNQGIALAKGDVVYFFDDDVVVPASYVADMQYVFEHNAAWGGGMSALVNRPARERKTSAWARLFLFAQYDAVWGGFTLSGMPVFPYNATQLITVGVLNGCAAYKREVFTKHWFDEKLSGYAVMEDCDMSCRVSRDYPLFFNPHTVLYHVPSVHERDTQAISHERFMHNYKYPTVCLRMLSLS